MNRVHTEESTGADKHRKKILILAQIGKVERERAARKNTAKSKKAVVKKVDLIFDKDFCGWSKGLEACRSDS